MTETPFPPSGCDNAPAPANSTPKDSAHSQKSRRHSGDPALPSSSAASTCPIPNSPAVPQTLPRESPASRHPPPGSPPRPSRSAAKPCPCAPQIHFPWSSSSLDVTTQHATLELRSLRRRRPVAFRIALTRKNHPAIFVAVMLEN